MKYIFRIFILSLFLTFLSCSHVAMLNSYNGYVSEYQLDSLCKVENIPFPEYEKWITMKYYADDNYYNTVTQYTYIKSLRNKNMDEVIYVVTEIDSLTYKFNKRVAKTIKK